jgi:hypothetical protein
LELRYVMELNALQNIAFHSGRCIPCTNQSTS